MTCHVISTQACDCNEGASLFEVAVEAGGRACCADSRGTSGEPEVSGDLGSARTCYGSEPEQATSSLMLTLPSWSLHSSWTEGGIDNKNVKQNIRYMSWVRGGKAAVTDKRERQSLGNIL